MERTESDTGFIQLENYYKTITIGLNKYPRQRWENISKKQQNTNKTNTVQVLRTLTFKKELNNT